ncbi:hypothetical protein [Novosphingobium sp. TCA1]|uniref:hypothetical protein n=1 Tax=Novosphingobium sp. TCA1 TaxID=2682474 RepID=UPI001F3BA852|nr:hypothetical protein [Novosphingobium sp. TCA1]
MREPPLFDDETPGIRFTASSRLLRWNRVIASASSVDEAIAGPSGAGAVTMIWPSVKALPRCAS